MPKIDKSKVIVGAKQLRKALQRGEILAVFLAQNADPAITQPIEQLCRQVHITPTWISTMRQLGEDCGIEVGAAAAAVRK